MLPRIIGMHVFPWAIEIIVQGKHDTTCHNIKDIAVYFCYTDFENSSDSIFAIVWQGKEGFYKYTAAKQLALWTCAILDTRE